MIRNTKYAYVVGAKKWEGKRKEERESYARCIRSGAICIPAGACTSTGTWLSDGTKTDFRVTENSLGKNAVFLSSILPPFIPAKSSSPFTAVPLRCPLRDIFSPFRTRTAGNDLEIRRRRRRRLKQLLIDLSNVGHSWSTKGRPSKGKEINLSPFRFFLSSSSISFFGFFQGRVNFDGDFSF